MQGIILSVTLFIVKINCIIPISPVFTPNFVLWSQFHINQYPFNFAGFIFQLCSPHFLLTKLATSSTRFPHSLREATIIPIAKPEKDSKDPNNCRPIALPNCVCKNVECMINDRLVWFLESSSLITEAQNGFQRTRSTMDHLVCFETFLR